MKLFNVPRSMLKRSAGQILSETKILLVCHRFYATRTTHYDVLRLKKNCSSDDIRESFAKLSKMYHPDLASSKTGSVEHNSRKFQEIMEAYRVLSKKSSRDAYDSEISYVGNYSNPHHQFTQRDRQYYDAHSAYWQQMHNMRNQTSGYYRNGHYNNFDENWNPAHFFNKKSLYTFLLIFISMNFFVIYSTYRMTKQNQILGYSGRGQRILYEIPRHGAHGIHAQHFERSVPKDE